MPYSFGIQSKERLATCHPVLVLIAEKAIHRCPMDFTILSGYRTKELQNSLVAKGRSKTPYPKSKHNRTATEQDVLLGFASEVGQPLSWAIDVAPWYADAPNIRWDRQDEFRWLAGFILGIGAPIAEGHGFRLRWGGDWDSDGDHSKTDNPFMDLPHIELVQV